MQVYVCLNMPLNSIIEKSQWHLNFHWSAQNHKTKIAELAKEKKKSKGKRLSKIALKQNCGFHWNKVQMKHALVNSPWIGFDSLMSVWSASCLWQDVGSWERGWGKKKRGEKNEKKKRRKEKEEEMHQICNI